MDVLRTIHAHNKFLVLLVLVLATVVLLVSAARGRDWGKLQRAFYSATHGLLGLQVVLGLVVLFHLGLGVPYRMEHLGIMLLAFGLMHLPMKWKRETGPERARKTGLVVAATLGLVILGIARLPFPFFGVPKTGAAAAPATAPASQAP
ncbi:hypothetical protein L6V77_17900 [Myxococcota bacterium]|nr:hypothetical protein [Myxococcota bacterium]